MGPSEAQSTKREHVTLDLKRLASHLFSLHTKFTNARSSVHLVDAKLHILRERG